MNASDLHNLLNAVIIDLRSLLLSSKDGLTERELQNEYKILNGRDIPFSRLGYNCLYDFLQDLISKGKIKLQRKHGNLNVYFAFDDHCTYQLRNLVRGQIDRQNKNRDERRFRESRYINRYNPSYSVNDSVDQYQSDMPNVPYYIQNQIKTVLEKSYPKLLSPYAFKSNFNQCNGYCLNVRKYGFNNLKSLLESLKHFVELKPCPLEEYTICLKELPPQQAVIEQQQQQVPQYQSDQSAPAHQQQQQNSSNQIGINKLNELKALENEITENLKILIKHFNDKGGLWTRTVPSEYKNYFKKELNVSLIGYRSIIDFLNDRLDDYVRIKRPERYGDYLLFVNDLKNDDQQKQQQQQQQHDNDDNINNNNKQNESSNDEYASDCDEIANEITHVDNLKQLIKEIRRCFKRDTINFDKNKLYSIIEFKQLFESKSGLKIYLKDYGCKTLDQLIFKLNDEKVLELKYDENRYSSVKYRPENSDFEVVNNYKNVTNDTSSIYAKSGINLAKSEVENAKFWEKFLREHVAYYEQLDQYKVLDDIDLTQEQIVIVSHILNPFELSIQISKNIPKLDDLMDDLERAYLGVGASHYNMKREYILMGKYCSAVYPGDKNWHRCKILEIDNKKSFVRVSFIDYGGEANVPMNDLKFLCRRFINLPQQAILARLSNLTYPNGHEKCWPSNITDYLLKKVQGKVFKAKFDGTMCSYLTLTLHEIDPYTGKVGECLNELIAKDAFAASIEDKLTPFESSIYSRFLKTKRSNLSSTSTLTVNKSQHASTNNLNIVNKQSSSSASNSEKSFSKEKPTVSNTSDKINNKGSNSIGNQSIKSTTTSSTSNKIEQIVSKSKKLDDNIIEDKQNKNNLDDVKQNHSNLLQNSKTNQQKPIENNNFVDHDEDFDEDDFNEREEDGDSSFLVPRIKNLNEQIFDKELWIRNTKLLMKKFENDIAKLKLISFHEAIESKIIDEIEEKENYIHMLDILMNKHL